MESVLMPSEIDIIVETMQPQIMRNLGSPQWLEWHNRIQKLHQEALVEAAAVKEEHVQEALVSYGKAQVLIHEAVLVHIWKYKVLPKLLKLEPEPQCTFIAYSVLYHEAVCVSLLELVMYHASFCEALDDAAVDLLDYISGVISQLLNIKAEEEPQHRESAQEELDRQRGNLSFEIGIRALSMMRYLTENLDRLPISVCNRVYGTHDVPVLLVEILHAKPWLRNEKQYYNGKWTEWDGERLAQAEAQAWLTLRHLLLDPECPRYYPVTENRRNQLVRLICLMGPHVLDQLSPLVELKNWLCRLSCLEEYALPPKPILLEPVLEIKEGILRECGGKWRRIAENQLRYIFTDDKDALKEAAKKLTDAYNTDLIEQFETKQCHVPQTCTNCGKPATQRCSGCKKSWYCSRACQVDNWRSHKENCHL